MDFSNRPELRFLSDLTAAFRAGTAHLLDEPDFDYALAGAYLLGHDMRQVLAADGQATLAALLINESAPPWERESRQRHAGQR